MAEKKDNDRTLEILAQDSANHEPEPLFEESTSAFHGLWKGVLNFFDVVVSAFKDPWSFRVKMAAFYGDYSDIFSEPDYEEEQPWNRANAHPLQLAQRPGYQPDAEAPLAPGEETALAPITGNFNEQGAQMTAAPADEPSSLNGEFVDAVAHHEAESEAATFAANAADVTEPSANGGTPETQPELVGTAPRSEP